MLNVIATIINRKDKLYNKTIVGYLYIGYDVDIYHFSNRVIDVWNELPENVVMVPTLNSFKSRLNKYWYVHSHKFDVWCYIPGERTRHRPTYRNTSIETREPNQTLAKKRKKLNINTDLGYRLGQYWYPLMIITSYPIPQ